MTVERFFDGLTLKLAGPGEREAAFALRRQAYLDEFGEEGFDEYDERAYHLIAIGPSEEIIGAMRVIGPEGRPFDLEHFVSLPELGAGRIPAEVGRFCIERRYRQINSRQFLHLAMFKLLYEFCLHAGITDLFTLGLPELKNLYKLAFFRTLDRVCTHPIGNRSVQLMQLELPEARQRHQASGSVIARLLFQTNIPNIEPFPE